MADDGESLESLLNKATNPSNREEDWEYIMHFCDQVNKELEGSIVAVRLIAHKIQSPQEKEALYGLTILEACVKNCGRLFHQEIGKFRFLNEIIKVVSPKYLGKQTSEKVKKRCIEIMYSWSKGLEHEHKIVEAYKMLKAQGIVKEDPKHVDKTLSAPTKPRVAVFEDEEKSKLLAKLLKSKNQLDLQAANRLIKNMVKQDTDRMDKVTRRINELETINNNIKVLTEMLSLYKPDVTSTSEKEMMKEIYDTLEKLRPNLFRLASDVDEKDSEALNEILRINDTVMKVMGQYKLLVMGVQSENGDATPSEKNALGNSSTLLDLFDSPTKTLAQPPPPQPIKKPPAATGATGLDDQLLALGLSDTATAVSTDDSSLQDLNDLFSAPQAQAPPAIAGSVFSTAMPTTLSAPPRPAFPVIPPPTGQPMAPTNPVGNTALFPTSVFPPTGPGSGTPHPMLSQQPVTEGRKKAMEDLDLLGQNLLQQRLPKENIIVPPTQPQKLTLNQMQTTTTPAVAPSANANPWSSIPAVAPSQPSTVPDPWGSPQSAVNPLPTAAGDVWGGNEQFALPTLNSQKVLAESNIAMATALNPTVAATSSFSSQDLLQSLADVFVSLESIQPGTVQPLTAYDKNNLKIIVHFGKDCPRPDVNVMVVSIMSTNTKPVKNFGFQAAVPKVMKVKLQPPSATDLPAYNPILPPTAITQVMLLANPDKEIVRLRFKLTYSMDNLPYSDHGEVLNFPLL